MRISLDVGIAWEGSSCKRIERETFQGRRGVVGTAFLMSKPAIINICPLRDLSRGSASFGGNRLKKDVKDFNGDFIRPLAISREH